MIDTDKNEEFQIKLNEFINDFYQSKEYLRYKYADRALYDSPEMREYNEKKKALEAEANILASKNQEITKEYIDQINSRFIKLKESIENLDCVKEYEDAYRELMEIRNLFNRELLRKLYL